MLGTKDLFAKSVLAGMCFGFGIIGAGIFPEIIQGAIITFGFLFAAKLGYPLFTEKCGDARLMTTFMGYITPDAMMLKLLLRRILPGNLLGVFLITTIGFLILPESAIIKFHIDPEISWWAILVSSTLAGIAIDLGSKAYRDYDNITLAFFLITIITTIGFNHCILDLPKVMYCLIKEDLCILVGIKILLFSFLGNFFGTRLRTFFIKSDETLKN